MSGPSGHDLVREMLALAALDALSPAERHELDAHLTTCDECRRELAALRDGVASIAESLPAREIAPERAAAMRARLMERAIEDRANVTPIRAPSSPSSPAPSSTSNVGARPSSTRWLAAAAFVLAAAAPMTMRPTHCRARCENAESRWRRCHLRAISKVNSYARSSRSPDNVLWRPRSATLH